jgi:WD40 repeat protein
MPLEHVADLPGHTEPAWAVAFNPTRPIIASCSTDRTVRLYQYHLESNPPRVEYLKTISTNHTKSIRSISWAPSGKTLATGSFDSSVAVWEEVDPDQEDGEGVDRRGGEDSGSGDKQWECVTTLEGHESECKSVAFSSDGALLASCSRDKSVWVWEGKSILSAFVCTLSDFVVQPDSDFECIAVMMEHGQDVKSLAWHPHEEVSHQSRTTADPRSSHQHHMIPTYT